MRVDREKIGYHCWVTNKTDKRILLKDIGYAIDPYKTVDVLDCRHSRLSLEQVEQCIESGSISKFLKANKVAIRQNEPVDIPTRFEISKSTLISKSKTLIELLEKQYKELEINISDEEYAAQNSEFIIQEAEHRSKKG